MKSKTLNKDEMEKYRNYCRRAKKEEKVELNRFCVECNDDISSELYFGLVNGLSYENISKHCYIPVSKPTFYRYQNKVVEQFRDYLVAAESK